MLFTPVCNACDINLCGPNQRDVFEEQLTFEQFWPRPSETEFGDVDYVVVCVLLKSAYLSLCESFCSEWCCETEKRQRAHDCSFLTKMSTGTLSLG